MLFLIVVVFVYNADIAKLIIESGVQLNTTLLRMIECDDTVAVTFICEHRTMLQVNTAWIPIFRYKSVVLNYIIISSWMKIAEAMKFIKIYFQAFLLWYRIMYCVTFQRIGYVFFPLGIRSKYDGLSTRKQWVHSGDYTSLTCCREKQLSNCKGIFKSFLVCVCGWCVGVRGVVCVKMDGWSFGQNQWNFLAACSWNSQAAWMYEASLYIAVAYYHDQACFQSELSNETNLP